MTLGQVVVAVAVEVAAAAPPPPPPPTAIAIAIANSTSNRKDNSSGYLGLALLSPCHCRPGDVLDLSIYHLSNS